MEATINNQYVEVRINEGRYALEINEIHEIVKMRDVTRIPNSKEHIKGVMNLRGKVVPIISLRNRFGLPETPDTKATRIIVTGESDDMVGIIVDEVNQTITLTDIEPYSDHTEQISSLFFKGVGNKETEQIGILMLEQILQDAKGKGV